MLSSSLSRLMSLSFERALSVGKRIARALSFRSASMITTRSQLYCNTSRGKLYALPTAWCQHALKFATQCHFLA